MLVNLGVDHGARSGAVTQQLAYLVERCTLLNTSVASVTKQVRMDRAQPDTTGRWAHHGADALVVECLIRRLGRMNNARPDAEDGRSCSR